MNDDDRLNGADTGAHEDLDPEPETEPETEGMEPQPSASGAAAGPTPGGRFGLQSRCEGAGMANATIIGRLG